MSSKGLSGRNASSRASRTPALQPSSVRRPARAADSAAVEESIVRLVTAAAVVLADAGASRRTADPAADAAAAADEVDDRRNGCRMCKRRRRRRRAALVAFCAVACVLALYVARRSWPSLVDRGEERQAGGGGGLPLGRFQPAALTPLEPPTSDAAAACTGYDGRQWPPHAHRVVDGARHCIAELRALTQNDVDLMAQSLVVNYAVVSNFDPKDAYSFRVTLENNGSQPVGGIGWEIYFCNVHMLFPDAKLRGNASMDVGYGLRVANANGCLFRLFPGAGSVVFESGRSVVLDMVAENWVIAKSDVMPNWYVAAPNTAPKVIANTVTGLDFTSPFNGPEKWKRRPNDRYNPIAPHERYSYYEPTHNSDGDAPVRPLPTPKKMVVVAGASSAAAINLGVQSWLVEGLDGQLQGDFPMTHAFVLDSLRRVAKPDGGDCSAGVCLRFVKDSTVARYHYTLSMAGPRTVAVHALDDVGALAAAKTLYQFQVAKARFDSLQVDDGPRFAYRGVMLDIVRNFQSKDVVKRLIDVASLYKLNRLHLRLADDEGWRLQIEDLPELTEVASRTCYDPTETVCILPEFGAAPDGIARFLTRTDYLELVQYAAARDIQIVPEFDMPGHSRAAIKAMEARYRKLVGASVAAAEEYLLSDRQDTSVYRSIQLYTDNAMNPCLNSTYRFIRKVVSTVQQYHVDVGQNLSFIHMGGDEVPVGAWVNSSACQPLLMARAASAYRDSRYAMLKKNFVKNLYAIMSEAGLGLALWEDGFMDETSSPYHLDELSAALPSGSTPQPVYAFVWQNVWEWQAAGRAYRLANAGYKVILMPATHFYFDHPQEPDPEERGFYWATRFTGTNKTFGFMPGDMYANINLDLSRFGAPLSRTELCSSDIPWQCPSLNPTLASNIIGVQGGVFAETCRTETDLQGLMFPRLIALAERAWHEAAWESIRPETSARYYAQRSADWREFAASVGRQQLPMLAAKGIEYHLSPPGVKNSGGVWLANTEFPGQTIQYSTDDGHRWLTYYRSSPPTDDPMLFSTVDASGDAARLRRSRVIAVSRNSSSAFASSFALLLCALTVLLVIS